MTRLISLALVLLAACLHAEPAPLKVVGVLGNSSGLSDRPFPYAFYTGIAADVRGRLYLAGASEGIPVCDQDGVCLGVLPLPGPAGAISRSMMVRAGNFIFCCAGSARGSALFRIDTSGADAAALPVVQVAAGPGHWAVSTTPDAAGRVIVGESDTSKLIYSVSAFDPATGRESVLFSLAEPKGATPPWMHNIQVDPDGGISIHHAGGVDWSGRYDIKGVKIGPEMDGQILDRFRYFLGYEGIVRRTDLDGNAAPGDCGSGCPEIRRAAQVIRVGDRYFFAGRGGAVEARWDGTTFVYTRRIGGVYLEDLVMDGGILKGVAYTSQGNNDVQHPIELPINQPIGQLLQAGSPLHGKWVQAMVPAPEGMVYLYRNGQGVNVCYAGPAYLQFDQLLPEVKTIGQAAVMDRDLLIADPKSGTIWKRPLMAKQAPAAAWRVSEDGESPVIGLAVTADAVYVSSATHVSRLSRDGQTVAWTSPGTYQGIRRLAATTDFVYVCDTAGNVVDQLDARTGEILSRLGETGQAGSATRLLNHPYSLAADLDGVFIADNGNGRVLAATTTLWQPQITRLAREDNSPIVAAIIPVKPPVGGRLSVNVYDANDVTVAQVTCAQPSVQPVIWDGRDLYGHWAKPGVYQYHGIVAPKLSLKYVTSIGQSGNPPYRTADGKGSWGGVWGDVMDICPVTSDPASDIVVLWAFEEGEGGLIRMSQDGEVRWKAHLDWWMQANQEALASDGASIYVLASSALNAPNGGTKYGGEIRRPMLWRVDAATGAHRLYSTDHAAQPLFGEYLPGERVATSLLYHEGKLYFTSPAQNRVFVADASTGAQLAAWPVENASGISVNGKGEFLVGSGTKIIALDAAGAVARTVADAGGEIWALKTAPGGGFATSIGAPRHQVAYFDAEGKEVRALGQPGGRPLCGKMIPDSFLNPVGLCVTGSGRLFVAEHSVPRRFTRWSADGKLERQFHGPYYLSGMFAVDDENPEYVYGDTHGSIIRYKVDYQTGQWDVDRYWTDVYGQTGVPAKWWARIRRRDGKTYWCSGSGGIVELADDHARGVAAVYGGWVKKAPSGGYEPVDFKEKTGLKGTWSDLNGDGQKQPAEWQVTDYPVYPATESGPQQGWGAYFDEKFDLYMHDWSDGPAGGIWKIPVTEWKNGVPIYRWDQSRQVGLPRGNGLEHGASGARTAFAYGDGVYGFNGGYNAAGLPGVGHGHDWEFAEITKYDPATGKPIWHAGKRAAGYAAPGEMYCPTGAAGIIDDYLFWNDENSLVQVWDAKHGLYVDTLLEDGSRDPKPSPYTVWVELFNSRVFRHPKTGKVYLMAASDAIHVFEVIGTEQKPVPFSGSFTLTPQGLAAAQARWAARTPETTRTLRIARAPAGMKIDGDLTAFAASQPAEMDLKPTERATARLLYDEKYLYLAFNVQDESPWKNAGGDISTLFKTGDTVDLWVGPSAGKRQPGIGDVRVLFAPNGEKTAVVAFRPKVAQGARPVPFRSPSGEVRMDRVDLLDDVPVVVKTTDSGYRLEAAIPRAEIGLESARFGLDLSLNFSDPAGQRNVACLHWGRNGASMVYDLPSEARFEPETWGIGMLE